ncbi:MauE/DoxX family redox-associated membrane protein [Paenibacillus sp. MBLB4367]|uniref:MauE/DoxX family redox-associated membrane protein n=1 Tax=Paenibacillus sp. MBLB4367 TaxID=3384767 RepID=UPI003908053A
MNMIWINWLLSAFVFLIYYKSGVLKLRNPYAFVQIVNDYKILKWNKVIFVAPLLSVIEVLVAFWIIVPQTRLFGVFFGSILQIIFIGVLYKNLGRKFVRGCGCFELNVPKEIKVKNLLLNFSLLILLGIIFITK